METKIDRDAARICLNEQLQQLAEHLPDRSRITKLVLDAQGRVSTLQRQKMVPLEGITILSKELDFSDIESAYAAMLPAYLAKAKTLQFDEPAFLEVIHEIEAFVATKRFKVRTVGFIFGCSVSTDFRCGPVTLGPTRVEYLEHFYNTWGPAKQPYSPFSFDKLANLELLLPATMLLYEQEVEDVQAVRSVCDDVEAILQAIALAHGVCQSLLVTPLFTFSYLYQPELNSNIHYLGDFSPYTRRSIKPFKLSSEAIAECYTVISQVRASQFLALKKLLSALARESPDDKFLDLITALESVLKIDKELRYRLSLYCAAIHGRNMQVYKDMLRLYELRSKIVHGEAKLSIMDAKIQRLDEIVRPVIRYALDHLVEGKSLQQVKEAVERILLPGIGGTA